MTNVPVNLLSQRAKTNLKIYIYVYVHKYIGKLSCNIATASRQKPLYTEHINKWQSSQAEHVRNICNQTQRRDRGAAVVLCREWNWLRLQSKIIFTLPAFSFVVNDCRCCYSHILHQHHQNVPKEMFLLSFTVFTMDITIKTATSKWSRM